MSFQIAPDSPGHGGKAESRGSALCPGSVPRSNTALVAVGSERRAAKLCECSVSSSGIRGGNEATE